MRKLCFIILISLLSCSQHEGKIKNIGSDCLDFWYKRTYYSNNKIHTETLLSKDTVPLKIISYRNNGSIEAEFLFGKDRDSLGYGLVIHYDSSISNRIENVEIVGINTSNTWKGYTLFYREKEIMKIDSVNYENWKKKINVKDKNYYFDW
jgi:hypothetical protein